MPGTGAFGLPLGLLCGKTSASAACSIFIYRADAQQLLCVSQKYVEHKIRSHSYPHSYALELSWGPWAASLHTRLDR